MVTHPEQNEKSTRLRILDAAADLFAEVGYAGASVKQIAERAGVTGAMIHYYFQSKENLYRAVLDRVVSDLETMAREIIATRKPPVERLEIYLRWFFDYAATHPHFSRAWLMSLGGSEREYLVAIVRDRFHPLAELGRAFFEAGIDEGIFKPVDIIGLEISIYSEVRTYFAEQEFLGLLLGIDPLTPERLEAQKKSLVDRIFRILGIE
jgi:TetR/AcrR family transcriptional regulator